MSAAASARPRGKTGLALLLFALATSLLAYATVGLGERNKIPAELPLYGGLMIAGFFIAWLVVRKTARRADPVLLPVAALLTGLGFAMIARIQSPQPPLTHIAQSQFTWLMIGLLAFVLTWFLKETPLRTASGQARRAVAFDMEFAEESLGAFGDPALPYDDVQAKEDSLPTGGAP